MTTVAFTQRLLTLYATIKSTRQKVKSKASSTEVGRTLLNYLLFEISNSLYFYDFVANLNFSLRAH